MNAEQEICLSLDNFFVDMKFMTSQSFVVEDEQERCLAFGTVFYFLDQESITTQSFFVNAEQE